VETGVLGSLTGDVFGPLLRAIYNKSIPYSQGVKDMLRALGSGLSTEYNKYVSPNAAALLEQLKNYLPSQQPTQPQPQQPQNIPTSSIGQ
jgi:hypothetical protein